MVCRHPFWSALAESNGGKPPGYLQHGWQLDKLVFGQSLQVCAQKSVRARGVWHHKLNGFVVSRPRGCRAAGAAGAGELRGLREQPELRRLPSLLAHPETSETHSAAVRRIAMVFLFINLSPPVCLVLFYQASLRWGSPRLNTSAILATLQMAQ
jgi:hypothetical protein